MQNTMLQINFIVTIQSNLNPAIQGRSRHSAEFQVDLDVSGSSGSGVISSPVMIPQVLFLLHTFLSSLEEYLDTLE